MKRALAVLLVLLSAISSHAAIRVWTNTLGGDWFNPLNWSPAGAPTNTDLIYITNNGTYTVSVVSNAAATLYGLTLGGSSGTQTLLYGNTGSQLTVTNGGTVRANGVLTITNGGLAGYMTLAAGAQLNLNSPSGITLYGLHLTNQGTVNWMDGHIGVGGSSPDFTSVTNSGLWQITTTNQNLNEDIAYGGGGRSIFFNTGTIRKLNSPIHTTFSGMDLINLPSGLVDVESGTLQFTPYATNVAGGSFTVNSPGAMTWTGSSWVDSGGVVSGTGSASFSNGTFYLSTNVIPGMSLAGGDIYIVGITTFQQAGAITNLTLNGATLHGTNRVAGTLVFNAGGLVDVLTVQPAAQLYMTNAGAMLLYGFRLNNQGTVTWGGAGFDVGGTPGTIVSNSGTWLLTGDDIAANGGGNQAYWTNYGTVKKIGGTANSALSGFQFLNQSSGLVEVDTGTIYLPNSYTNYAGELRMNAGTLASPGGITLEGGILDGTGGLLSSDNFQAGTVSPGLGGPGAISFISSLNFGSNATYVVNGTGTIPATQYSQLQVTGAVVLANCKLQVASLPAVPAGTTFMIITNDGVDAVSGTFNGLPEGSTIAVGAQSFQIHYAGGSGNDVTLVRGGGAAAPHLGFSGFTNGDWRLSGSGGASTQFTVQATTNFLAWTNVGTVMSDGSGNFLFIDTNSLKFHYRFYRTTN